MAIGADAKAGFVALNRFAFGARGGAYAGDLARAASDPRGLLKAELMQPGIAHLSAPTLPTTKAALQAAFAEQERIRIARQNGAAQSPSPQMAGPANAEPPAARDGMGTPSTPAPSDAAAAPAGPAKEMSARPKQPEPPVGQRQLRADALARFQRAARAEVGFAERLVHFWSNHFCISAAKGPLVRVTAGCFEREAIRPHVLGRFADMLQRRREPSGHAGLSRQRAVVRPELAGRAKPQSRPQREPGARDPRVAYAGRGRRLHAGRRDGAGAHHHRLDLRPAARDASASPGRFAFFPNAARAGRSDAARQASTRPAASSRARRRSPTSRDIRPRRAIIAAQARAPLRGRRAAAERSSIGWPRCFARRDGDLKAVAVALVDAGRSLGHAARPRCARPQQFLLAALRAIDRMPEDPGALLGPLNVMGMPLWQPPGPNGWPDTVSAWASPKGMKSRLDVSARDRRKGEGPRQPVRAARDDCRGRPHRARRARRSRAPNRASRGWRCC